MTSWKESLPKVVWYSSFVWSWNERHLPFVFGQNEIWLARPYFIWGMMLIFPSPFPSLSVTGRGHSLIRQVASPLSPKMNCMHRDVTRQCIFRGLSIKKAESYYWCHESKWAHNNILTQNIFYYLPFSNISHYVSQLREGKGCPCFYARDKGRGIESLGGDIKVHKISKIVFRSLWMTPYFRLSKNDLL